MKGGKQKSRPNYASLAFHNPYNYALMGGMGMIALMTINWWLFIAGAGLEVLWMLFAPDSVLLQKLVWDPQFQKNQRALVMDKYDQILDRLSPALQSRFRWILESRDEILRLSAENPSFTAELLREELEKVDTLSYLFGELAVTIERYENYLQKRVHFPTIENEIRRLEKAAKGPAGDIARKNLEILDRRKEKAQEILDYVAQARAQMDLIENTFQLLADQVLTLQSPHELGGQLDELINGVEAIRDVSREAEKILQTEAA